MTLSRLTYPPLSLPHSVQSRLPARHPPPTHHLTHARHREESLDIPYNTIRYYYCTALHCNESPAHSHTGKRKTPMQSHTPLPRKASLSPPVTPIQCSPGPIVKVGKKKVKCLVGGYHIISCSCALAINNRHFVPFFYQKSHISCVN
jgi:hypothetical protein